MLKPGANESRFSDTPVALSSANAPSPGRSVPSPSQPGSIVPNAPASGPESIGGNSYGSATCAGRCNWSL